MEYPDYKYVDTACGGIYNRNNIQEHDKLFLTSDTDCYCTYFRYPEKFQKHFSKNKNDKGQHSVGGYKGFAYADYFPIDIDDKDNLEEALKTAKEIMSKFQFDYDVDVYSLPIFFSGNKGFHIYIPAKIIGITPSPYISDGAHLFCPPCAQLKGPFHSHELAQLRYIIPQILYLILSRQPGLNATSRLTLFME